MKPLDFDNLPHLTEEDMKSPYSMYELRPVVIHDLAVDIRSEMMNPHAGITFAELVAAHGAVFYQFVFMLEKEGERQVSEDIREKAVQVAGYMLDRIEKTFQEQEAAQEAVKEKLRDVFVAMVPTQDGGEA